MLFEAAELEHGLSCSYLFAAFSLKTGPDAGLSPSQSESVARWRGLIVDVAKQEMLHLALVSNLLTALGAAPHLDRPRFPQESRYYPAGITISLRRFDERTLTRFVNLERPDGFDVEVDGETDPALSPSSPGPAAPPGALREGAEAIEEVTKAELTTVGALYQAIEDGFEHLVEVRGEEAVFIGAPAVQAESEDFSFGELHPVTDLTSARRALKVLVEQGEGVQGDWEEAHYGKFLKVRDELRDARVADPEFDPAWPVLENPIVRAHPDVDSGAVVGDELAAMVMDLFNGTYTLMTTMLARYFAHTDESPEALRALADVTVGIMFSAISPLGGLLATMPAGDEHPGATAGASFELHRAVALIPHRRAAWATFQERLAELAVFADRIADHGVSPAREVGASLRELALQLADHT